MVYRGRETKLHFDDCDTKSLKKETLCDKIRTDR